MDIATGLGTLVALGIAFAIARYYLKRNKKGGPTGTPGGGGGGAQPK